jgi:hypothetical protein
MGGHHSDLAGKGRSDRADRTVNSPLRASRPGGTVMKTRLMHLGVTLATLATLVEALGAGVKW